jgi:HicB_like antitoxin of bacterial toxin-antitoxin system
MMFISMRSFQIVPSLFCGIARSRPALPVQLRKRWGMGSMSNTTRCGVLIDSRRSGYGVGFPDLPGCTAMGRTLDEALQHAMGGGQRMKAIPAPRPRLLEACIARWSRRESGTCRWRGAGRCSIVSNSGKGTKANISLDAGMLQAIDQEAAAHGLTRSAFMASAALEKIRRGTWGG